MWHNYKSMVKTYIKLAVIGMFALSSSVMAGSDLKTSKEVIAPNDCKFRNNELQLDVFGTGGFYQQGNPAWGGGVGVNYFFLKYVGLGVEQDLMARDNASVWGTFGNVFLRYPICSWNLAPYAVAGLGGLYGNGKSVLAGTVGGGLEYRITDHIGVFADARWLYNGSVSKDGAILARTGIKFAF